MRRLLALIAVLALVGAACGRPPADPAADDARLADPPATAAPTTGPPTTATPAPPTTEPPTTTTSIVVPEGSVLLSYQYDEGTRLSYEFEARQLMSADIEFTGDPSALGEEELPEQMELSTVMSGVMHYDIADGPEPGTTAITISTEFGRMEVDASIGGESFSEQTDIPDLFPQTELPAATIIVDEKGNVVNLEVGGEDLTAFLDVGGFGNSFTNFGGNPLEKPWGPPLPDGPIEVGTTWTIDNSVDLFGDVLGSATESVVTNVEDGIATIESRTHTDPFELDFVDMMMAMMEAFADMAGPGDETPSEDELRAELEAMGISMTMAADASTATYTTTLDLDSGTVIDTDGVQWSVMRMDMTVPDEVTGELVQLAMYMDMQMSYSARLLSSDG